MDFAHIVDENAKKKRKIQTEFPTENQTQIMRAQNVAKACDS